VPIWLALFLKLQEVKSEPQNIEYRMSKEGVASGLGLRSSSYDPTGRLRLRPDRSLCLYELKLIEFLTATFDIHISIFDFSGYHLLIKLAALRPSAGLTPET